MLEAILRVTEPPHQLLRVDRLPQQFVDYLASLHFNTEALRPVKDCLDYTKNFRARLTHSSIEDGMELIAVKMAVISDFYGGLPMRRYGQWRAANKMRMLDINALHPKHVIDLTHAASGGLWEFKMGSAIDGFYVIQKSIDLKSPFEVLMMNYDITYNLSRLVNINARYNAKFDITAVPNYQQQNIISHV